jgi:hypothetical protein
MFIFAAELENNMERNLLIELLEDGEKVPHTKRTRICIGR